MRRWILLIALLAAPLGACSEPPAPAAAEPPPPTGDTLQRAYERATRPERP